jgi:hypothetical protein
MVKDGDRVTRCGRIGTATAVDYWSGEVWVMWDDGTEERTWQRFVHVV